MIPLPKLLTRRSYWIIALVLLLPPAVMGYWLIKDPGNTVTAVPAILVIELFFVGVISKSMALDPERGSVVTTWLFFMRRDVPLGQVQEIDIRSNGAGSGDLVLCTTKRAAHVPLIHLSSDVQKSRDAAGLSALADAVATFVPAEVVHRDETVGLLRQQAAWSGAPQESPLGPFVSTNALAAGQSAGGLSIFSFLK